MSDQTALAVVAALRRHGSARWIEMAQRFVTSANPAAKAELLKLLGSRKGLAAGQDVQFAALRELGLVQKVSPTEFLRSAKTRYANAATEAPALLAQAEQLFGPAARRRLTLSFARLHVRAGEFAEAVQLLAPHAALPLTEEFVSKIVFAHATSLLAMGINAQATLQFDRVALNASTPRRFRLLARLQWAIGMTKMDRIADVQPALAEVASSLGLISDARTLLDFAMQLRAAPEIFHSIRALAFSLGQTKALADLAAAVTPAAKVSVLLMIGRRYFDFELQGQFLALWQALRSEEQAALWSVHSEYWELLALVARALQITGDAPAGLSLAENSLAGAPTGAATPLRYVAAKMMLSAGRKSEALQLWSEVCADSTTREEAYFARYWLALAARSTDSRSGVAHHVAVALASSIAARNSNAVRHVREALSHLAVWAGLSIQPLDSDAAIRARRRVVTDLRKLLP